MDIPTISSHDEQMIEQRMESKSSVAMLKIMGQKLFDAHTKKTPAISVHEHIQGSSKIQNKIFLPISGRTNNFDNQHNL